jgi:hypothetical protein
VDEIYQRCLGKLAKRWNQGLALDPNREARYQEVCNRCRERYWNCDAVALQVQAGAETGKALERALARYYKAVVAGWDAVDAEPPWDDPTAA